MTSSNIPFRMRNQTHNARFSCVTHYVSVKLVRCKLCSLNGIVNSRIYSGSRGNSLGILTRLRTGWQRKHGSITGRSKGFSFSPNRFDQLWGPTSYSVCSGTFSAGVSDRGVKLIAHHCLVRRWRSTPPCAYMACIGTTFLVSAVLTGNPFVGLLLCIAALKG